MYTPASFQVQDRERLLRFIQQHSFGVLVSQTGGEPTASHLPLLVDGSQPGCEQLIGHMARANSQWREADGQTVLAVFHGPHAYVSPTWYAEENVVPTWNYVAVHVYGRLHTIDDEQKLLKIVSDTVAVYESSQPTPWQFDATTELARDLVRQIVGFRIEITRLEGKWKLNQNHSSQRQERVAAELQKSSGSDERAIAAMMRAALDAK